MAEKVKAKDTVTVYATGKGKHLKTAKAHKVHKIVAQKLISRGLASYSKPKEEKDGKGATEKV